MKAILAILGIVLAVIGCLVVPTFTHGIATAGAIIGILCLWGLGFKNIEVGFIGHPILFGVRIRCKHFNEGWCWRFPLFMDIKVLDNRIQTRTIETPFVFSQDDVRVSFKMTIWFQIVNPFLYLGTKPEDILGGINDVAERRTRHFIKEHTGKQCRRADEELEKEIEEEMKGSCGDWGIEITKLAVKDVDFTPEHEDAIEAEQSRRNKVKGDAAEIKNLRKRVKKTQEELELSAEKALEADQLQTRTIQKQINKIDIGENLKEALEKGLEKAGEGLGRVAGEIVAGKMKKFGGKK